MDKSFSGLFGNSPRVKVWEFLLISRGNFEYNIKDISNGAAISRPSCYKELNDLKRKGVVIKGGKYKGKQLYKLNKRSGLVKSILESFHYLIYKAK